LVSSMLADGLFHEQRAACTDQIQSPHNFKNLKRLGHNIDTTQWHNGIV
jgi:hypothetical protein